MLIDLNENYMRVFVRKFAFMQIDQHLKKLLPKYKGVPIL